MLGPFLFFGASSAVMLYLVIVFNRLPNDEFARRIESAEDVPSAVEFRDGGPGLTVRP